MSEPQTPPTVEDFLTTFRGDPKAWTALSSGDQARLFEEVVDRMRTAQSRVVELEAQLVRARDAARDLLALVSVPAGR